jgi:hypothetical protein
MKTVCSLSINLTLVNACQYCHHLLSQQVRERNPDDSIFVKRTFHIVGVETADAGTYTCKSRVASHPTEGVQTFALTHILNHQDQAYIGAPVFHGDPVIVVGKRQNVNWIFDLKVMTLG